MVLRTHSPAKKICGSGIPILDRMTLVNLGKENSFAYHKELITNGFRASSFKLRIYWPKSA